MNADRMRAVSRGYRFADHIPYSTPSGLDELRGPTTGLVRVRPHIDTSQDPVYDLSDEGDLIALYSAVVRSGTGDEQGMLLDRATLERLWPVLVLPRACRDTWTDRFGNLRALGLRALSL